MSYNVNVLPNPEASFSINNPYQCFYGNNFIFTDLSSSNNGPYSRLWNLGMGSTDTSSSLNPSKRYIYAGLYFVKLLLTGINGCTDSLMETLSVYPKPNVGFVVNAPIQCLSGNNFTFCDTSHISTGFMQHRWLIGGLDTSSQACISKSFGVAGTYTAKLVVHSDYGCSDSVYKNVYVVSNPHAFFTVDRDVQCERGNQFVFTDSSLFGAAINRTWYFGDGSSDTSQATRVGKSYTGINTYTVKLKLKNDSSCSDSFSRNITVNPSPNVRYAENKLSQCFNGNQFLFADSSAITAGTLSGTWYFGDSSSSVLPTPSHTFLKPGTYHVMLVEKSNLNCIDSLAKTINVYPNPVADFSINQNGQCLKGNRFIFDDASSISLGTLQRHWNLGTGAADTSSALFVQRSYTSANTFSIQLTSVSEQNCLDSKIQFVYVYPQPGASVSSVNGLNHFCLGDSLELEANTGASFSYRWMRNNLLINGAMQMNLQAKTAANYRCIVSSQHGCADTSNAYSVTADPLPVIGSMLGPTNVTSLAGAVNYNVSQQLNCVYTWAVSGGNIISGQGSNSIMVQWGVTGTGKVHLLLSNGNNCSDTQTLFVNVSNGIANVSTTHSILLYPNPNHDMFQVASDEMFDGYLLYDVSGNLLDRQAFPSTKTISIGHALSAGIYYLHIQTKTGTEVLKLSVIE